VSVSDRSPNRSTPPRRAGCSCSTYSARSQFERDLIRERSNAGLKAARERGSLGGRRPVITPDKLHKVRDHIAAGLAVREAATRLKVGKTAPYKALEGAAAKTAVKA
jgi:DNA invertase Pin-like site-specific DNA recombinase